MADADVTIVRTTGAPLAAPVQGQVDAIFFEASGRTFEPGAERDAFRERWLGRYLDSGTDEVFLALAADETVAGYLVGDVRDPAGQTRFDDIGYFRAEFAHLSPAVPGAIAHQPRARVPQSRHRRAADRGLRRTGPSRRRARHARRHRRGHAQRALL